MYRKRNKNLNCLMFYFTIFVRSNVEYFFDSSNVSTYQRARGLIYVDN